MRWLVAIFLVLTLSACLTSGRRGNETPMAVFDLGQIEASTASNAPVLPIALETRMPLWLDTMGIDYRLAYLNGAELREYSRARWSAPPSQLLQQRLLQTLNLQQLGQVRTHCVVRLEIDEFAQIFSSSNQSAGVLQGRVQLLDRSRSVLATQNMGFKVDAISPDARGGVQALRASVEQMSVALKSWLVEQSAGVGRQACAG